MTSAQASATLPERVDAGSHARSWATVLVTPATMIVILAASLLLLMTPIWTHFALGIAWGGGITSNDYGFLLSDRTISEVSFGPGTFSDFGGDEAAHMRDVRVVFWGFMALAIASAGLLAWRIARHGNETRTWRSIARGGVVLAAVLVAVGAFAVVAFDVVFELFHRIFFPGGNWAFPADSLLIRLYPYAFWQMSAAALGFLAITAGLVVWWLARRRARSLEEA